MCKLHKTRRPESFSSCSYAECQPRLLANFFLFHENHVSSQTGIMFPIPAILIFRAFQLLQVNSSLRQFYIPAPILPNAHHGTAQHHTIPERSQPISTSSWFEKLSDATPHHDSLKPNGLFNSVHPHSSSTPPLLIYP
jgi:hypothetical protein